MALIQMQADVIARYSPLPIRSVPSMTVGAARKAMLSPWQTHSYRQFGRLAEHKIQISMECVFCRQDGKFMPRVARVCQLAGAQIQSASCKRHQRGEGLCDGRPVRIDERTECVSYSYDETSHSIARPGQRELLI